MARSSLLLRQLAALGLGLVLVACDSKSTPAPPSPPAASDIAAGTREPGGTGGPVTSEPRGGGSPGPDSEDLPAIPEVPFPQLGEPFAIGQALYDPGQMTQGVVSLLALMGVGIYREDGTAVDNGVVTHPGGPWLYESEVWGLIQIGTEDMVAAADDGPRYRLHDLFDALKPAMPELSLDSFVAAYADSYAAHPDDLAPSVLLGQPVDSTTPLNRVQIWLLYMDGFVDLPNPTSADVRMGPVAAANRPRAGTANAVLPPLPQPQALTFDQWRELSAHFMTIVDTIRFQVVAPLAHEGHGGLGTADVIKFVYLAGKPFVSPVTGLTLLAAGSGPLDGLQIRWTSRDVAKYNAHGTLAASIPGSGTTDAAGHLQIAYTPKQEVANGQGAVIDDAATITATADARDLLLRAYKIDLNSVTGTLMASTLRGQRSASDQTILEWHAPGIELTLTNNYDVTMNAGTIATVASAHRKGTDVYTGTLTKRSDGTYRGTFISTTQATADMQYAAGLAGGHCYDTSDGSQYLLVVARRVEPRIDVGFDVIASGSFGPDDFVLRFYPASDPGTPSACQGNVEYFGLGPDGQPNFRATYASFSDSRITDPSFGGYRIHLPKIGESLKYEDWRQTKENLPPDAGVDSTWTIEVDRQTGS
jgi:hypothetical protein